MTHPCEVKITKENLEQLKAEATNLGQPYVDALTEQAERQVVDATPM